LYLDYSGPSGLDPDPSCTSELPGAESSCTSDLPGAIRSTDLPIPGPEQDTYQLGKTYYDLKEYDRAAFFTKSLTSSQGIDKWTLNLRQIFYLEKRLMVYIFKELLPCIC